MNMRPPKYAKSVTVQAPEQGVTTIQVTAVYKGNQVEDEVVTVKLTEWVVGLCSFGMFVFLICISELHQALHGGWAALASELSLTMNCNFSQAGSRPPS